MGPLCADTALTILSCGGRRVKCHFAVDPADTVATLKNRINKELELADRGIDMEQCVSNYCVPFQSLRYTHPGPPVSQCHRTDPEAELYTSKDLRGRWIQRAKIGGFSYLPLYGRRDHRFLSSSSSNGLFCCRQVGEDGILNPQMDYSTVSELGIRNTDECRLTLTCDQ